MSSGLKRGTRPWLFAIRCHFASDPDIVALTEELEIAWDKLESKGDIANGQTATQQDTRDDDEYNWPG